MLLANYKSKRFTKSTDVKKGVFLSVAETIESSLLCCCVGIVQCLCNLLYYVIWRFRVTEPVSNTKKPPKKVK